MKSLNFLTLLYIISGAIFFAGIISSSSGYSDRPVRSPAGRNENSTPRTFVLPATPAVAGEQERLQRLLENEPLRKRCMLALHDLGYFIGNIEAIDNIDAVVATIRFQRAKNLSVSGDFDPDTSTRLGCSNAI